MLNKLRRIMGLKDKVEKKVAAVKNANEITKADAAFIIAKLRKATYVGTEFEQFYQIMAKLSVLVDKE
jgi:F0F1-type ATP synthase gamma subunit